MSLDLQELLVAKLTRISSSLDHFSNHYYSTVYSETNLNDARYLLIIGARGEVSAADIISETSFDKATVSRNIKRLINKGLLRAKPDNRDARRTNLMLSDRGRQIYQIISKSVQMRDRAALLSLTQGEKTMLFELLEKLQLAADLRMSKMDVLGGDPAIDYGKGL